jgi:HAMP domain-containing protein
MLRPPIRILNPIVGWVARLRWSLHTKLLAGFLLLVLLLFSVGAMILYFTSRVEQRTLRVAQLAEEVSRAGRIEYAVTAQMHFRAMALLTGDPSNDQKLIGARQDFSSHLGYLEAVVDSQEQAILARLREANVPFQVSGQKVDRLAQAGDLSGAMKVHLEEEHPRSHVLEGLARDLIKAAESRRVASLQEVDAERQQSYTVAGIIGVGGLGLALFLGYVLSWPLLGAVGSLDEHLTRVTRGDFSQEIVVPNGDEFQALAVKANEMMHELARARSALLEQNAGLAAQARKVEELNRRLEGHARQQTTDRVATHPRDPDATFAGFSSLVKEVATHPAGLYRCEVCGTTGRISREVKGEIRCPNCKGTQFARVSPSPA